MNQEMQNQLTQLVSQLNSAVFFAQDQLPDVINQLLTYHLYSALMWVILSLAILIPYVCKLVYDTKHLNPNPCSGDKAYNWVWDIENDMHGMCLFHFFALAVLILILICNAENLLKILCAPKLFVLDYIRSIA